ncbi:MAG: DNA-directed RNA polymerase subunit omega [Candidatus Aminicenantes bacterium]
MKTYGEIDSKFRFVILAAKRAKQLLQGAKPRIKSKSKNPIRIAQKEVRDGFIDYELIEVKKEEIPEPAEEGFIGEEIGAGVEEIEEAKPKALKDKDEKPEKKPKVAEKKKPAKKVVKAKEKKPVKKAAEAKEVKPVKKAAKKSEKKETPPKKKA